MKNPLLLLPTSKFGPNHAYKKWIKRGKIEIKKKKRIFKTQHMFDLKPRDFAFSNVPCWIAMRWSLFLFVCFMISSFKNYCPFLCVICPKIRFQGVLLYYFLPIFYLPLFSLATRGTYYRSNWPYSEMWGDLVGLPSCFNFEVWNVECSGVAEGLKYWCGRP